MKNKHKKANTYPKKKSKQKNITHERHLHFAKVGFLVTMAKSMS
jgi:hypothetical protein